jgi:hypothetical protein
MSQTVPLCDPRTFRETLARHNTAGDGSPTTRAGTEIFYGPGIVIETMAAQREVRQALVSCIEEELAWLVMRDICRDGGWKMQDMESGQIFG